MALQEPVLCTVDIVNGTLENGSARYEKTLADLAGVYADAAAYERLATEYGGRPVYEVTDYRPTANSGDLIIGVTRMSPGQVGDEFFLTRGHIHAKADRPEIYYGQAGRGVMLMESPQGESRAVEINPGEVCYVPPYWIHRSVNVSHDDLVMVFCYPADAGQNYDVIARSGGMRHRVVATDGGKGWELVENTDYRPRDAAELERLGLAGIGG